MVDVPIVPVTLFCQAYAPDPLLVHRQDLVRFPVDAPDRISVSMPPSNKAEQVDRAPKYGLSVLFKTDGEDAMKTAANTTRHMIKIVVFMGSHICG